MISSLDSFATWQILAAIGVTLAMSEIFVPGFVVLPIGLGFLLTAVCAAFVHQWAILLGLLAVFQLAVFWAFKKYGRDFYGRPKAYTNVSGMVGQECVVTEAIAPGEIGYVKLYGDFWQAKSYEGKTLEVGKRVAITKLEGNKVFVEPVN